ncbi:MAG: hypothetical protein HRU15_17755 [Planctomycetes bacterium]|nr:hypothetical protein [Planctomycetota bacterium]
MSETAYVAASGYEAQLEQELSGHYDAIDKISDRLFIVSGDIRPIAWAVNSWFNVERIEISSIGHAAKELRERGPYWSPHMCNNARRCQHISDKLLRIKDRTLDFPNSKKLRSRGAFCLIDENHMLCSKHTSRPFADGAAIFNEDHENPPARAYLKIWESLTLLGEMPGADDCVLEMGAAPGAWTWTLANLGSEVHSIDRAPLDDRIDALPNVHHRIGSAFAIEPKDEKNNWLCSDIICYPERLLSMIDRWLKDGHCQYYNITIKFQGESDLEAIKALQEIPNSWLIHLHNNKNEVTWIKAPSISGNIFGYENEGNKVSV